MFKFVILSACLAQVYAQAADPYEVCVGYETGTKIGVGYDISCTAYFDCEDNIGYEEDCAVQYGDQYQFSEETGECDFSDVVQCVDPDPLPDYPDLPIDTPEVTTTQAPVITTPGGSTPDIECPTNQPGQILFFPSSNCSEYFICSNGNQLKLACMEGFTWNQQDKQCDYPIYSKCSSNIEDDGMNVRCTRTGFYSTAYPRDCTRFVFCSAGIPIIQNCPIGYAWHIDRCVERMYASCPDARRYLG